MASSSSLSERLKVAWARRRARAAVSAQVERGDAILDPSPEIRLLLELPGDFIPDEARKLARDLFGLLLFLDMTPTAGGRQAGAQDSYALLRRIRACAWQGYGEPEALADHIRARHPRSDVARRFILYCNELAEKRSTYLFLPIVAQIDRHQATHAFLENDLYRMLGEATARQDDGFHAGLAKACFALAPDAKERAAFVFASMLAGFQLEEGLFEEHLEAVATQLKHIVHARLGEMIGEISDDSASVIAAVSEQAPWIWLEALVVVENWIAGPQWFDHAFEIELRKVSL